MARLQDPVTILKGVGPSKAKQFAALNIYTLQDLICHFPRGYEDRTKLVTIDKLEPDVPACFKAMVMNTPRTSHIRKGLDITKVQVADHTARLNLTFFNQKFTTDQLQYGKEYVFYGAVSGDFIGYNMTSPSFEPLDAPPITTRRVLPIYPLTAGLSNAAMLKAVRQALSICEPPAEILPQELRQRHGILPAERAYYAIHEPASMEEAALAKKRLIFEEFFIFSAGLALMRTARAEAALDCDVAHSETPEIGRECEAVACIIEVDAGDCTVRLYEAESLIHRAAIAACDDDAVYLTTVESENLLDNIAVLIVNDICCAVFLCKLNTVRA